MTQDLAREPTYYVFSTLCMFFIYSLDAFHYNTARLTGRTNRKDWA